jgi:rhodanese-related sulfurtransferase
MSQRGLVIVAALFVVAFVLLALGQSGYRKVAAMQSMENAVEAVRRDFPAAQPVSGAELAAMLAGPDKPLLIDVRTAEEFALSHLPGAVRCDNADDAVALSKRAGRIVLYDSTGARSAKLAEILARRGVREVAYLGGGIFQWANGERPLVDGDENAATKVHPYNRFWGRLLKPGLRGQ